MSDRKVNEPEGIVEVDVDEVIVPEERVTSIFDPETYEEFLESVRAEGIKVPIICMRVGEKLYLIDGLHRLKAAKELGIKKIKAIIRQGTEDDLMVENIITARLRGRENPAQTAKVIKALRDRYGYSWSDIARRLGMSPGTVKIYYDITRLPEQVLQMIAEGKLSISKARLLLDLPSPRDQIKAAEDVVKYGYNEIQTRELVKYYLQAYVDAPVVEEPPKTPKRLDDELKCYVCNSGFSDNPTYVWMHHECLQALLSAFEELQELKKSLRSHSPEGS